MMDAIKKTRFLILLCYLFITACGSGGGGVDADADVVSTSTRLNNVDINSWMYQIQDLDDNLKIDDLAKTDYDMLVVEAGHNFVDFSYDTAYLVSQLIQKENAEDRVLLAYIDIGEAEDYRTYWQSNWVAPTASSVGSPSFLVTIDPDGWEGNYPVAYWHQDWKDIWLGSNGIISQLANAGFHGVYLDWVEAYDDDSVRAVALADGVNPEEEMMLFIEQIKAAGRAIDPEFLVVAQNAPYLLDYDAQRYSAVIDAIATEDTWFYGEGDAAWNDANAGDLFGDERHFDDYSTESRIRQNQLYLAMGIPVFTVDYCTSNVNASQVYRDSRNAGFIPLVTRVSLSEITETPAF